MKYKFLFKVDKYIIVSVEDSKLNNDGKEIFIIQNEKSFNKINSYIFILDLNYSDEIFETIIKFNEKY